VPRGGRARHDDNELLGLLEARQEIRSKLDKMEKKIDASTRVPDNYKCWTVHVGRRSISKETMPYPPL
jgi:hypothetical protein